EERDYYQGKVDAATADQREWVAERDAAAAAAEAADASAEGGNPE
ncbi:MAG: NADH-quinone oxidoreductase subunit NuoI, partial [Actinomycetales bacterium]|nr:NADH-quinone oxidoreductase subunit NuoI [Actinomycetales bacterium]